MPDCLIIALLLVMPSSLFDHQAFWRSDPANAFAAFVLSPEFLTYSKRQPKQRQEQGVPIAPAPLRSSSAKTYIAMFAKFLRWLEMQQKTLFDIDNADLLAFLDQRRGDRSGKVLNSVIRSQYLGLLERVYLHLQLPNPAKHACFDIFQSGNRALLGKNAHKAVLTDAEQAAFMQALPGGMSAMQEDATTGWKRRRDRAMQALMLGAGLKVSEVVGAYTDNLGDKEPSGSVPVTISPAAAGGTVRWHQTQLRPFAVQEVLQWVVERKTLGIPGPLLFPATLQGGRLNKATVYRQVRATFERAGIDVARQGGRTLRNAFAIRELNAGAPVELVGEFMGHRKRRAMDDYLMAALGTQKKHPT